MRVIAPTIMRGKSTGLRSEPRPREWITGGDSKGLDNPSNLRGDNHNCEKIVFDAIQLSGIINNDKQIIAHEIIPGIIKNPPSWTIKIEPYERPTEDLSL
jgi:Holliday junction resolvase RusA-like endonuclease